MRAVSHDVNIVQFFGACTITEPAMLVMEYMRVSNMYDTACTHMLRKAFDQTLMHLWIIQIHMRPGLDLVLIVRHDNARDHRTDGRAEFVHACTVAYAAECVYMCREATCTQPSGTM